MTEQEELEYEMPDEINFSIGRPNPYTAPAKGRVVNVQVERELYNLFASDEAVSEALRNYAEARKEAA